MYQIDMSILRGAQNAAFKTADTKRVATSVKPMRAQNPMRVESSVKTRPFPKLGGLKPEAAL